MIRDEVRAWPGYKTFRQLLAPGTRESTWLRTVNPYIGWALWHQPRRQRFKPESTRSIRQRERAWLRSLKPAGYTWKLWHQHKGAVEAHRKYLAERHGTPTPKRVREAA